MSMILTVCRRNARNTIVSRERKRKKRYGERDKYREKRCVHSVASLAKCMMSNYHISGRKAESRETTGTRASVGGDEEVCKNVI